MRRPDPLKGLPREVGVLVAVAFAVAVGFGIVAPAIPVFARSFHVTRAASGRGHQRVRGRATPVRADQRPPRRPVRRTPRHGRRHRHRRRQQRGGRPGPDLRRAAPAAGCGRRGFRDVQRLGLLPAPAYGARGPARARDRRLPGRLPARRCHRSGARWASSRGGACGPRSSCTRRRSRSPGAIGLLALRSTALRDKEAANAQETVPLRKSRSATGPTSPRCSPTLPTRGPCSASAAR